MDTINVRGTGFFYKNNKKPKQYNYLTEDITTDVIIVGGGIGGCLMAYHMAKKGINVAVLEKYQIGSGSTSIATSLLQYELDSNIADLLQYTTENDVIKSYKLCKKSLDNIDTFFKQYGNKSDYRKCDCLLYTASKAEVSEIEQEYNYRIKHGFDVEIIEDKEKEFSFDIKKGIYSKEGGAVVDPFLFAHQLAEVADKHGAKIYENTSVRDIEYTDKNVIAHLNFGLKVTGNIIIAATGYSTDLFTNQQYGSRATTFNIVTKPVKEILGWKNECIIRDNKQTYTYLRTTGDNRIIAGGEDIDTTVNLCKEDTAEEKYEILLSKLKFMFPLIKDIEIDYQYCGNFASSKDDLGYIGKDPKRDKLWYTLGYGGNGIVFLNLAGMLLSELYLGNKPDGLELFSLSRFNKG